ncbi:MAG: ABC transporter permease [Senegalia sp. (in: firmicutes)]
MNDLYRNIIYQAKNNFRDKGFLFWSLAYPILMASFFYLAFSGITNLELEDINVGIESDNRLAPILESIDILNVEEISSDEASESLKNQKIEAFIEDDLTLLVSESGLNETVIKSILEQIVQTNALNRPLEEFDYEIDYLKGENQEANGILVIFYSLIAMVSTYGVFVGMEIVEYIQANLTTLGARINTTPIKKHIFLISGVIVGLFLNLTTNAILLFFIEVILKLDLIKSMAYSALFILLGNLFGVSLGMLIGVSNKKSLNFKTMLAITSTLVLSALSGLFTVEIKILIEENLPILGQINPIAIITNNLYKINLLANTNDMGQGIMILISYFIVFSSISLVLLRRKKYDSI